MKTELTTENIKDSFLGICYGTFCGDALGMPFENWSSNERIKEYGIVRKMCATEDRKAGSYTDDTQMMFGILETVAEKGHIDQDFLVERFVQNFDGRGYGQRMRWDFIGRIKGLNINWRDLKRDSFGNGGAMRVAPLVPLFFDDIPQLIKETKKSCETTHTHPLAIDGTIVQAISVALAMNSGINKKKILPEAFIEKILKLYPDMSAEFKKKYQLINSIDLKASTENFCRQIADTWKCDLKTDESVPPALACFLGADSFEEAVVRAMNSSWDADTVPAMTGAIAGAFYGYNSIPENWLKVLENKNNEKENINKWVEKCMTKWIKKK